MPLKDQLKNYAKKLVEDRPDPSTLRRLLRFPRSLALRFKDDGVIPNNPRFPVMIYRNAISLRTKFDPAAVIDALFESNGWSRSWRDSIYDFLHYHSQVHEVLGVARGSAKVELGGVKGKILSMKAGDVAILPAGTGHRLIDASRNFQVVGAYPIDGAYDECTDTRDRVAAAKRVAKVRKPQNDPVYGQDGPMTELWRARRKRA